MTQTELIETLCEVVQLQAEIIKRQAELLSQSDIEILNPAELDKIRADYEKKVNGLLGDCIKEIDK